MEVDDDVMSAVEELIAALPKCIICNDGTRQRPCDTPASYVYDDDHYCKRHMEASRLTDFTRLPWADALEKLT